MEPEGSLPHSQQPAILLIQGVISSMVNLLGYTTNHSFPPNAITMARNFAFTHACLRIGIVFCFYTQIAIKCLEHTGS
jgi:hypothetical protein